MQALKLIEKVSRDGYVHVKVPSEMGGEVELIILPHPEIDAQGMNEFVKIQEQSGFVKKLLASETEDVWNDL